MTPATIRLACSGCSRDDKDGVIPEQLEHCKKAGCPVAPRDRSVRALPVPQKVADLGQEFLVLDLLDQ
jgi:hypothetical protein